MDKCFFRVGLPSVINVSFKQNTRRVYQRAKKNIYCKRFFLTGGTALSEFYLANAFLQAKKISLLPKMLKPLNKTKMEVYFENLAKVLYKKIKPKE